MEYTRRHSPGPKTHLRAVLFSNIVVVDHTSSPIARHSAPGPQQTAPTQPKGEEKVSMLVSRVFLRTGYTNLQDYLAPTLRLKRTRSHLWRC